MLAEHLRGKYQVLIIILSVIVPLGVAVLLFMPEKIDLAGNWTKMLPHLNGGINTLTTAILIMGFIFIRAGKIRQHKTLMSTAFILGVIFLISYILYHSTSPSTVFGDMNGNGILEPEESEAIGFRRGFYLIILLSHILLAVVVVPFVLFAFYYALTSRFDKHKKIVRYTLPVWLYVSITGVIVYLMISPYYN
jgi:putative membrane protein